MIPLIGITGRIGSGKSTLATNLVNTFNYKEYAFADPLKEICKVFGFTDKQLYGTQESKNSLHPYFGITARSFMQQLGTNLFRNYFKQAFPELQLNNSVWVELFKMKYETEKELGYKYIISDVRFQDEADLIKRLGGIIIRTYRNQEEFSLHDSENDIDYISADIYVDNSVLSETEALQFVIDNLQKVNESIHDTLEGQRGIIISQSKEVNKLKEHESVLLESMSNINKENMILKEQIDSISYEKSFLSSQYYVLREENERLKNKKWWQIW